MLSRRAGVRRSAKTRGEDEAFCYSVVLDGEKGRFSFLVLDGRDHAGTRAGLCADVIPSALYGN